jgi:hypothetical protein
MKDTFYKEYVQSLIKIAAKHLNNGFSIKIEEEFRKYSFINNDNEITLYFEKNGEEPKEPQVSILWYVTKSGIRKYELEFKDGIEYSFYKEVDFEKIMKNMKTKIELRGIFIKNRN